MKVRKKVIYSFSSYFVPEISAVSWAFIETNEPRHLNVEHLQGELFIWESSVFAEVAHPTWTGYIQPGDSALAVLP